MDFVTCRSFPKYEVSLEGVVREIGKTAPLTVYTVSANGNDVEYVIIKHRKKRKRKRVAELFALTFLPRDNPNDRHLVCINGNWKDYRKENFRWSTKRREVTANDTKEWHGIKRYPEYEVSEDGEVRRKLSNHILHPFKLNGLNYVNLNVKVNGKWRQKAHSVNFLVATAFVPNPYNKTTTYNIDGNVDNVRYTNIAWGKNPKYIKKDWKPNVVTVPVDEFDLSGNLVKEWRSMAAAAKITKTQYKGIRECARGFTKTSGNRVWRFHGEPFDKFEVPIPFRTTKKDEEFKKIEGTNFSYVSNLGRVIHCRYYEKEYIIDDKNRIKIQINGKPTYRNVPKLVATYFVDNPNNYCNVTPKDGNILNRRADNLMWTKSKFKPDT